MKLFILVALISSCLAAPFLDDWRVSGGQQARLGQFPFTAWINLGGSVCSGSIIGRDTILTAAHCTYNRSPGQLTVYVGLARQGDQSTSTHKVQSIHQNPNYCCGRTVNGEDISVLKLSTPIQFDANRQPINLGSAADVPAPGGRALFAGYGSPRIGELFWAQLTVANCIGNAPKAVCLTRSPASTEGGDSGGPLFVQRGSAYYQIGVNSGAVSSGSTRVTLKSRVDQHANFIRQYL